MLQQLIYASKFYYILIYMCIRIVSASLLFALWLGSVRSCLNDSRCLTCQLYNVNTPAGVVAYYNCDQCSQNRSINSQSGICECSQGYYETTMSTCDKC